MRWPLSADLEYPAPGYNGTFGVVDGSATIHGSLAVAAGANPALRIYFNVYGIVGDLVNHEAECDFRWGSSDSLILPRDDAGNEGRIAFHYTPVPILAPDDPER